MVARVALDLLLRKEFDYFIPPQLDGRVFVGTRVKVPFGSRLVLGSVTQLLAQSSQPGLKSINKVIGEHAHIPEKVFQLARWISEYYCCPLDVTLRSVLPEAVRQEEPGWKERLVVTFLSDPAAEQKLSERQAEILGLIRQRKSAALTTILKEARTTSATLKKLEEAHLISIAPQVAERDPYANEIILPTQPLTLNAEQNNALARILKGIDEPGSASNTFLLHGVTGSGKTEIYLQAIAHAVKSGKGAIVLVPEISLTPQTVERFKARFSSGELKTLVAVLHSHLSAGERHDEWQKIRQKRARIAIGARSAIFAPVDNLGLIIVDEEHEHSYKQEESPRYHARDCAVMRGQLEKAVVVLGSATPSLESYFNASCEKYTLLEMPTRVDDQKMPLVRVVDMRMEARKEKGTPIFSQVLRDRIQQRLDRGEQTILFLNRRGYASSLQCPKCGFVAGCPNCSVSLTYHRHVQRVICHICGYSAAAPNVCPEKICGNPAIRYAGIGTERVEETLPKLFPHARIARMDSDSLKRKDDYRRILGDFRTGKIDILLGTQMIAKGLHFPNVTLVGIIYADLTLHMPDFRASERTFQLLTQVSGRAGRGDIEGEVVVQAFTPFHPAIQYARKHDFLGFYDQEIEFRQQLSYPPLARIALLTLRGRNEEKVALCADYVRKELDKTLSTLGEFIIAGPAPAPLLKAENYFRYQIMIRGKQMTKLSRSLATLNENVKMPEDITLIVDIDPVNLV
jgi:primosomal protein N' (replication factor Y) (superfamily II helicase)